MPHNGLSSRCYSGINILILWDAVISRGFSSNAFLTFRQALELGGNVCKGARGSTIVYAHRFTPGDEQRQATEEGRTPGTIPFLKRFTVFNLDQCEGLPDSHTATIPPAEPREILLEAEALIEATGADFRIGRDRAFYNITDDCVCVPPSSRYFDAINWNRTAFHELGHWSGHRTRLDQTGLWFRQICPRGTGGRNGRRLRLRRARHRPDGAPFRLYRRLARCDPRG